MSGLLDHGLLHQDLSAHATVATLGKAGGGAGCGDGGIRYRRMISSGRTKLLLCQFGLPILIGEILVADTAVPVFYAAILLTGCGNGFVVGQFMAMGGDHNGCCEGIGIEAVSSDDHLQFLACVFLIYLIGRNCRCLLQYTAHVPLIRNIFLAYFLGNHRKHGISNPGASLKQNLSAHGVVNRDISCV